MVKPQGFLFRAGGLMRCCIQTLYDNAEKHQLPTVPGAVLDCNSYIPMSTHENPTLKLAEDGTWQWSELSQEVKAA